MTTDPEAAFEAWWSEHGLDASYQVEGIYREAFKAGMEAAQFDEKPSDQEQAPLKEESWKIVAQQYETAIIDLQKQLNCRPTKGDLEKEIADLQATLDAVECEVSKVYCHITDGKFSKANTAAHYVIEAAEAFLDSSGSEMSEKMKAMEKQIKDLHEELDLSIKLRESVEEEAEKEIEELKKANHDLKTKYVIQDGWANPHEEIEELKAENSSLKVRMFSKDRALKLAKIAMTNDRYNKPRIGMEDTYEIVEEALACPKPTSDAIGGENILTPKTSVEGSLEKE